VRTPSEFGRRIAKLSTEPAARLDAVHSTLLDEPLQVDEWALYEPDLNLARGEDAAKAMAWMLKQSRGGAFYKVFFSGNVSCGKSTEITRLLKELEGLYAGVRIDIRKWVNSSDLEAHEVLLAIVFATNDAMLAKVEELDLQAQPDPELVRQIENWAKETEYVDSTKTERSAEGGWKGLQKFGIDVALRARTSHVFTAETREKQRRRFSELMTLANLFLGECYEVLRYTTGEPEWLVLLEEMDKSPNMQKLKEVLANAMLFKDLQAHFICNIPTAARIAEMGSQLALPVQRIYDVPVYNADHTPNDGGRSAVGKALSKRVRDELFAEEQRDRLIVASGGNLRTLFRMVDSSAVHSVIRLEREKAPDPEAGPIGRDGVTHAINGMRAEYRDRLGTVGLGENEVSTADKLQRLADIYHQKLGHDIPDPVLVQLLAAGAVQIFNGEVRHAVHPLVVDVLADQALLGEGKKIGAVPGGSI
jgi:hypothetical protein